MVQKFRGINLYSKDPKRLVSFYKETLSIPTVEDDPNCDGVTFGYLPDAPVFWIWDANKWGTVGGTVCFVFECDSLDKTYDELQNKGLDINPPVTAVWGGKELIMRDPDGNTIMLLEN